jgi:hypothetical protein
MMFNKPYVRSILLSSLTALVLLLPNAGVATATSGPSCKPAVKYKRENFSNPTKIDNKFLPFVPGTTFTLQGTTNAGAVILPHQVIFTISDVTKVIDGVRTRVMFDRDISDGVLTEREISFFAQDDAGNVWNLGEYPEEIDAGKVAGAPFTWMNGLDDAQGGIHMLNRPKKEDDIYLQGWSPSINFLDCAQVDKNLTGQSLTIGGVKYDNVLVTIETSPLVDATSIQYKYHAPGVGIVAVGALSDPEAETLVMVDRRQLGKDEMDKINDHVCKQDKRGHRISKDVYGRTGTAELNGQPCGN